MDDIVLPAKSFTPDFIVAVSVVLAGRLELGLKETVWSATATVPVTPLEIVKLFAEIELGSIASLNVAEMETLIGIFESPVVGFVLAIEGGEVSVVVPIPIVNVKSELKPLAAFSVPL